MKLLISQPHLSTSQSKLKESSSKVGTEYKQFNYSKINVENNNANNRVNYNKFYLK